MPEKVLRRLICPRRSRGACSGLEVEGCRDGGGDGDGDADADADADTDVLVCVRGIVARWSWEQAWA